MKPSNKHVGLRRAIGLLLAVAAACVVSGEIERKADLGNSAINLYWWPKLPTIDGWEHNEEASLGYQVNALVPKGKSFSDAETIMYAKAMYNPVGADHSTVDQLIENDQSHFKTEFAEIKIKRLKDVKDGDGKIFKVFEFTPGKKGSWESVAYGEEGDYLLIFTISSKSKKGYKAELPKFTELLTKYREKLSTEETKPAKH